jgi:Tfp pilus assembly protein PilO
MSPEQPIQASAVAPRRQIPIRLDQLKRAPGLMVIGLPELIGLFGAALLAFITLFAYFYFYLPAQSRLRSTQKEAEQLHDQLRTSQKLVSDTTSTSEAVDQMTASVKDFESSRLAGSGSGRLSLYTELNDLIRSNGLRNTAGPSYTPLEPVGVKAEGQQVASAQKQGIAKWQSIYPGIAVSVTVEGPYQSVRHFVHDIEASRHFLIINAVELEGATQSGAAVDLPAQQMPVTKPLVVTPRTGAGRPGTATGPVVASPPGGRGSLVSLRLDMATYFQRSDAKTPTALPK